MAGWLEGISINETSQHNFYNMAGLRLLPCYVNSLFLSFYCAMLHNLNNWEICQIVNISTPVRNHNS